jgi:hypothetical protein
VAVRVLPMTVRDAVSQFPLAREVPDYAYLMTGEGRAGGGGDGDGVLMMAEESERVCSPRNQMFRAT